MTMNIFDRLPAEYVDFHENESFNFQLNRFYSQGVFSKDELMETARRIDGFESWIRIFIELGEKAESEALHLGEKDKIDANHLDEPPEGGQTFSPDTLAKLYLRAATCFRAAQFYTISGETCEKYPQFRDPSNLNGNSLKHMLYEKCRSLYDRWLEGYPEIKYTRIPFENYEIPVYYCTPENTPDGLPASPKGTVVIHGGYDSIAQEFLILLQYLQAQGYNVYFFEGPGQGEVLMRWDVRMTPEWEHCTSAVLDHFGLEDVTLIGISLGGYLAPRAAAYDRRITRLVMYDLIFDFYGAILSRMGPKKSRFFDWMTRHPKNLLWRSLDKKFGENYFTKWLLGQGYAIYEGVHTPCEYFNYIRKFNTREISPLLTQDVLVLAGESDLYTVFYQDQLDALTNARSVTGRLFTKAEHADHHCQIGNMKQLLKTVSDWIEDKTNGKKTGA